MEKCLDVYRSTSYLNTNFVGDECLVLFDFITVFVGCLWFTFYCYVWFRCCKCFNLVAMVLFLTGLLN